MYLGYLAKGIREDKYRVDGGWGGGGGEYIHILTVCICSFVVTCCSPQNWTYILFGAGKSSKIYICNNGSLRLPSNPNFQIYNFRRLIIFF